MPRTSATAPKIKLTSYAPNTVTLGKMACFAGNVT